MRVLIVSSYYPPHIGGVENYVRHLAQAVAHAPDHEVTVISSSRDQAERHVHRDGRVTVHLLPARWQISNTVFDPSWGNAVRRIIRETAPNVINIHAPVPGLSDIAARAGDAPMVLTYHTGRMRKGRPLIDIALATYERTVLRGTARRAARVVVSSRWVVSSLGSILGSDVIVVSPGFDDTTFFPGSDESDVGRLAFVGSLEKAHAYKGLGALIESLPVVRNAYPEVTLDVMGDGDAADDYRRLAMEQGVGDIVRFRGHLSGAELAASYRRCQALVLPTTFDSYPTVLVECLASGRPVISTTAGGVPEAVRDGVDGWLVPPGDSVALVSAMIDALEDPEECSRRGTLGAARVRTRTWAAVGTTMLELFDDVVSSAT